MRFQSVSVCEKGLNITAVSHFQSIKLEVVMETHLYDIL